jgi:hypothetical protein
VGIQSLLTLSRFVLNSRDDEGNKRAAGFHPCCINELPNATLDGSAKLSSANDASLRRIIQGVDILMLAYVARLASGTTAVAHSDMDQRDDAPLNARPSIQPHDSAP